MLQNGNGILLEQKHDRAGVYCAKPTALYVIFFLHFMSMEYHFKDLERKK